MLGDPAFHFRTIQERSTDLGSGLLIRYEKRGERMGIEPFIEPIHGDDIALFDYILFSACFYNCNHN